jgi:D-3-phosphoglycerate dehydrogenase
MMNIKLMNKIAAVGTAKFDTALYNVGDAVSAEDAIMVRSAALHEYAFGPELKAIARAGAGVNNIPVEDCAKKGIVVFNTPGANANGVKELAICALLLAARDVVGGVKWVGTLTEDVAKSVEKGKSAFAGGEIAGKTLGVIGLGAIGAMVANAAVSLGMKVVGCDPFLSVDGALRLMPCVKKVATFDEVFAAADYITLHVPATPETKNMINADSIAKMKDGVRIINLSRADLVDIEAVKAAIGEKKIIRYVTDFPTEGAIGAEGVVTIPHLGASTEESEDNCAVMAADELIGYLENGSIKNSVNYPNVALAAPAAHRIVVLHEAKDVSAALTGAITSAGQGIAGCESAAKGAFGATVIELSADADDALLDAIKSIDGVIRVVKVK